MMLSRTTALALALLLAAGCYKSYPRIALDEDATTDDPGCVEETLEIDRIFPGVFILLDRSRSMKMELASGEAWDYWGPATSAINSVVGSLEESVAFGLGLFPDPAYDEETPNCYAMPAASNPVMLHNAGAIAATFTLAGDPHGGTPTATSLEAALPALGAYVELRTASVLLVTDGAPNCNWDLSCTTCQTTNPEGDCTVATQCLDDVRTYDNLDILRVNQGVETYVVGLVGGHGGDWVHVMHSMAGAGGTGEAVLVEDPDDVEPVIEEIARQIIPCLFDVAPSDLTDLDATLFDVDGTHWARDEARLHGWDLVEADRIRFYGEPCDRILATGVNTIDGFVPCE